MEAKCGFYGAKVKSIKPLPDRALEYSENIFKVNGQK